MKLGTIAAWAALLFLAGPGRSRGDVFLRPLVDYNEYLTSGYVNHGGYGVALGFIAAQTHELSLEMDYSHWSSTTFVAPGLGAGSFNTAGTGQIIPYLLNYRFYLGPADWFVRFYVGPSVGLVEVRGHYSLPLAGAVYSTDFNHWSLAWAGSGGLVFALTKGISLEAGYRYLAVSGYDEDLALAGNPALGVKNFNPGSIRANVFTAGVTFAF
jgi:opacity protein-like surface antigen